MTKLVLYVMAYGFLCLPKKAFPTPKVHTYSCIFSFRALILALDLLLYLQSDVWYEGRVNPYAFQMASMISSAISNPFALQ